MKGKSYTNALDQLTQMVTANESTLKAFAWRTLASRGGASVADVQDVLSEAFLIAAAKLRDPNSARVVNYAAWYQRILFFVCLNLRKKKGRDAWVEELTEEMDTLEALAAKTEDFRERMDLRAALQSLDERERMVVELNLEGYTSNEIGERLSLQADHVRQVKKRALEFLRERLRL